MKGARGLDIIAESVCSWCPRYEPTQALFMRLSHPFSLPSSKGTRFVFHARPGSESDDMEEGKAVHSSPLA